MYQRYKAELADLRRACKHVLTYESVPMHFEALARAAYAVLGIEPSAEEFRKRTEDLREKVFDVHADGFLYTRKPLCLVLLDRWFNQNRLFNTDKGISIHITADIAEAAATEAQLRSPYMQNKFNSSPLERARRISCGFIQEMAVRYWAKQNWPRLYMEPLNEGRYAQPCNHDFRLNVGRSKPLEIDVAGVRADGSWGAGPEGKRTTDYHLIVDVHCLTVEVKGVVRGSNFSHLFGEQEAHSIERFVLVLNCIASGIDFKDLQVRFETQGKAA